MKIIAKQWSGSFFHYSVLLVGMIFLSAQQLYGQEMVVSGVVVDSQRQPMIGVTVSVKGTATGTVTNLDGNFSLKVPQKAIVLFSFIGYQTLERSASSLKKIH